MAALLASGGCFMLARTVVLTVGGALVAYQPWAAALLLGEFVVDAAATGLLVRWAATGAVRHQTVALRAVVAVIVIHAVRVLVFVLGRTGPWFDFDIRPDRRPSHPEHRSGADVWFAGIMAALSVVVLFIVAVVLRRKSMLRTR